MLFSYALQDTQLNFASFQYGPIIVSMKCCWHQKRQIFCTSLHFLLSFYWSFSISMIAWYIDQKKVLSPDKLWIHQSTMRQTDMQNPKQKHGRVYTLNIWIANTYQFFQKCLLLGGFCFSTTYICYYCSQSRGLNSKCV